MREIIFDIEADALLDKVTKVWCLSYCDTSDWVVHTIYEYDDILNFFKQDGCVFVGHFISLYDLPVLQKIVGLTVDFPFFDTIYASQYVFPGRNSYSLESFGGELNVSKVKVEKEQWKDLDLDLAKDRCENDVKINSNLYISIKSRLNKLYNGDTSKIVKYLAFKADCAFRQMSNPLFIDVDKTLELLNSLYEIKEQKTKVLESVMPKIPIKKVVHKPSSLYKKDGKTLTVAAEKWFKLLSDNNIDESNEKPIEYTIGFKEANANSHTQLKDFLYSLSWEPCTFRYVQTGVFGGKRGYKRVPQILTEDKTLTRSVADLLDKVPELIEIEGLGVTSHRISLLEGYLSINKDGWIHQELVGITSSMRYRQKNFVNVPSNLKPVGKEVRSLFVAPPGKVLFGCDLKNLESRTKDNFIVNIDPEYVKEMGQDGYDSHLDIAIRAGYITEEQAENHKKGLEDHSAARKKAKQVNFAAIYLVGSKTLSQNSGLPISECDTLLQAYWERNWAVAAFSKTLEYKDMFDSLWVKNPLTSLWIEIREKKDGFSGANQSAGVAVLDTWISYLQHYGIKIAAQIHDEVIFYADVDDVDRVKHILNKSCDLMNKKLGLTEKIGVDIKYGYSYSEVH